MVIAMMQARSPFSRAAQRPVAGNIDMMGADAAVLHSKIVRVTNESALVNMRC
jgi:hypothetical protein